MKKGVIYLLVLVVAMILVMDAYFKVNSDILVIDWRAGKIINCDKLSEQQCQSSSICMPIHDAAGSLKCVVLSESTGKLRAQNEEYELCLKECATDSSLVLGCLNSCHDKVKNMMSSQKCIDLCLDLTNDKNICTFEHCQHFDFIPL